MARPLTRVLLNTIQSRCYFTSITNPKSIYHPDYNYNIKSSVCLPSINSNASNFEQFFKKCDWAQKIIKSLDLYDNNVMKSKRYIHISAKDVVVAFARSPRAHRPSFILALIKNCILVQGIDVNSFPTDWKITEENLPEKLLPVSKLKNPFFTCQLQPYKHGIVYVYVDASEFTPKNGNVSYAGWAYVIVHNQETVDQGFVMGSTLNNHTAELEAINFGLSAVHVYLIKNYKYDERIPGVCMRSDSASALAHSMGYSHVNNVDAETQHILWDIYKIIDFFDECYFEHIPEELNSAADYLATYASEVQGKPHTLFEPEKYEELCEALITREVRVGYKVEGVSSVVS